MSHEDLRYTVKELAANTYFCTETIYRDINAGHLHSTRFGRKHYFSEAECQRYIATKTAKRGPAPSRYQAKHPYGKRQKKELGYHRRT